MFFLIQYGARSSTELKHFQEKITETNTGDNKIKQSKSKPITYLIMWDQFF